MAPSSQVSHSGPTPFD